MERLSNLRWTGGAVLVLRSGLHTLTRWVVSDDWINKHISKSVCYSSDWHTHSLTLYGTDSSAQPTAWKINNLQLVFSSSAHHARTLTHTDTHTHTDISQPSPVYLLSLSAIDTDFSEELRAPRKVWSSAAQKETWGTHFTNATESVFFTFNRRRTCQLFLYIFSLSGAIQIYSDIGATYCG